MKNAIKQYVSHNTCPACEGDNSYEIAALSTDDEIVKQCEDCSYSWTEDMEIDE